MTQIIYRDQTMDMSTVGWLVMGFINQDNDVYNKLALYFFLNPWNEELFFIEQFIAICDYYIEDSVFLSEKLLYPIMLLSSSASVVVSMEINKRHYFLSSSHGILYNSIV